MTGGTANTVLSLKQQPEFAPQRREPLPPAPVSHSPNSIREQGAPLQKYLRTSSACSPSAIATCEARTTAAERLERRDECLVVRY